MIASMDVREWEDFVYDDKELKELKESIASGKKLVIWGASPLCVRIAEGLNISLSSFTIWDTYKTNLSIDDVDILGNIKIMKPELANPGDDLTQNACIILAFSTDKNCKKCTKALLDAGYKHIIDGSKLVWQMALSKVRLDYDQYKLGKTEEEFTLEDHDLLAFPHEYNPVAKTIVAKFIQSRKNFEPQIVVKVDGGLGSQMTQYALGRGAGLASGLPVFYDLSWYELWGRDINGIENRKFEITSVFPDLPFEEAGEELRRLYASYFNEDEGKSFSEFDEKIFTSQEPRYLGGYYVVSPCIDAQGDALRDLFHFCLTLSEKNQKMLSKIQAATCSVALHVRRGDFIGSIHDVTTLNYFKRAIDFLSERLTSEKITFFVFSNGMEWARDNLQGFDGEWVFVDNNNNDEGAIDMYLMSNCTHFIISNSTFSSWPAWLSWRSKHKIVVMPDRSLSTQKVHELPRMKREGWFALPAE